MPRTIPTSIWNERPDINSSWDRPRDILDAGTTNFDSPRYSPLFVDNLGNKVLNNEGNEILLNGARESKTISSNWN